MFKCNCCSEVFGYPERAVASREDCAGARVTIYEGACPYCGSVDYEEAEWCKLCGDWHFSRDMGSWACDSCTADVVKRFKRKFGEIERNIVYEEAV